MNATELLIEQHDEVRALFKQLKRAGPARAKAILDDLSDNLAAHMAIEQELFYPAVLGVKEDLVLEGYEEHAVARFALARLRETRVSARTFQAKVKTLKEIIEDHADEEEQQLFAKSEKALGDRSEALAAEMLAMFDATMKKGYLRAVARGGSAVTTVDAPALH